MQLVASHDLYLMALPLYCITMAIIPCGSPFSHSSETESYGCAVAPFQPSVDEVFYRQATVKSSRQLVLSVFKGIGLGARVKRECSSGSMAGVQ